MSPDGRVIAKVDPPSTSAREVSEPGRAYAIYAHGGEKVALTLRLPKGRYRAEWLDPKTGKVEGSRDLDASDDPVVIASPGYRGDIAQCASVVVRSEVLPSLPHDDGRRGTRTLAVWIITG